MKNFAHMALVSREWNYAIRPSLYRQIVISQGDRSSLLLLTAVEKYHSFVRFILVDSSFAVDGRVPMTGQIYGRKFLQRCFELCTKLEGIAVICWAKFLGPFGPTPPTWPEFPAVPGPTLSPVRILLWRNPFAGYYHALRNAFCRLADTLEDVSLYGLDGTKPLSPNKDPFDLPIMPKLRRIAIYFGRPRISRVVALLKCPVLNGRSALREVVFEGVASLTEDRILEILSSEYVGRTLTTLHIRMNKFRTYSPSLPSSAMALCPALDCFSWTSASPISAFQILPKTLRTLKILASELLIPNDVVDCINGGYWDGLDELHLFGMCSMPNEWMEARPAIVRACSQHGMLVTIYD